MNSSLGSPSPDHQLSRVGQHWFTGTAAEITDPANDRIAREQIAAKYYGFRGGELPNEWTRACFPA